MKEIKYEHCSKCTNGEQMTSRAGRVMTRCKIIKEQHASMYLNGPVCNKYQIREEFKKK